MNSWCEAHQVDFVFGLAKNDRLKAQIITEMAKAQAACEQSGQPARRFRDFSYHTLDSWSRERRVVGKAEYLPRYKANPTLYRDLTADHIWSVQLATNSFTDTR